MPENIKDNDKEVQIIGIGNYLPKKFEYLKGTPFADKFTLSYFDGYGRAEPVRILLAHASVEYEDERIDLRDWAKLKNSKFYGNSLPVVKLYNRDVLT